MEEDKSIDMEFELAKFNMALPFLQRINDLLSEISRAYRNGELFRMKWGLKALYREIACKLTTKERNFFEKDIWVNKVMKSKSPAESFSHCEYADLWLRDRINERGLGIPAENDRRFFSGVK